jgi:hypothetical protein
LSSVDCSAHRPDVGADERVLEGDADPRGRVARAERSRGVLEGQPARRVGPDDPRERVVVVALLRPGALEVALAAAAEHARVDAPGVEVDGQQLGGCRHLRDLDVARGGRGARRPGRRGQHGAAGHEGQAALRATAQELRSTDVGHD